MKKNNVITLAGAMVCSLLLVSCVSSDKQMEADVKKPVNCATAEADIKTLNAEKAGTAQKIGAGISAVVPIGLVVGVASGTESTNAKIATGDYNVMIDQKIAEIQHTCHIH